MNWVDEITERSYQELINQLCEVIEDQAQQINAYRAAQRTVSRPFMQINILRADPNPRSGKEPK